MNSLAADKGCKLIAFPETFIPGYCFHVWMGAPAWAIMRGYVQRYFDNSLSYASSQAERLRQAVKSAGITAVLGLSEREGGSLYIAQWLIGPDGETISQRRKLLRHGLGRWLAEQGPQAQAAAEGFDMQRRAEEVPVAEYVALAQACEAEAGQTR